MDITNKTNYAKLSAPNIFAETPVLWMCAAEIYFLRAEGRLHGWNMGGEMEELYNMGITKSFEQWGVALGDYLTRGDDYKPVQFTAPSGTTGSAVAASTITIAWSAIDRDEKKLERIITQNGLLCFRKVRKRGANIVVLDIQDYLTCTERMLVLGKWKLLVLGVFHFRLQSMIRIRQRLIKP